LFFPAFVRACACVYYDQNVSARNFFKKLFSASPGKKRREILKIFFQNTTAKINSSDERETKTKAKKNDSFAPDVVVAADCDGEEAHAMPPRRRMVDPYYFSCFFLTMCV